MMNFEKKLKIKIMERLISIFMFVIVSITAYPQGNIIVEKDEFTKQNIYYFEEFLEIKDGTYLGMYIEEGINELTSNTFLVKYDISLAQCNNNSKIIFLFIDDTKIIVNSFNELNCYGIMYFKLTDTQINKLTSTSLYKIRLHIGNLNKDIITSDKLRDDRNYFIHAYITLNKL